MPRPEPPQSRFRPMQRCQTLHTIRVAAHMSASTSGFAVQAKQPACLHHEVLPGNTRNLVSAAAGSTASSSAFKARSNMRSNLISHKHTSLSPGNTASANHRFVRALSNTNRPQTPLTSSEPRAQIPGRPTKRTVIQLGSAPYCPMDSSLSAWSRSR